ncbi:hypothetical protein A9G25_11570 [Gilliamella sp. Bif1-4]|jgi:hypothetical protein|nr:hypothetical protein A9G25_11570 [Gilliamella apicola]
MSYYNEININGGPTIGRLFHYLIKPENSGIEVSSFDLESIDPYKNVPIDDIPHFEHERYWGYSKSKIPFANDKYSWPPILSENPHDK